MRKIVANKRELILHLLLWAFYLSYRFSDFPGFLGLSNGLIYITTPLFFNVIISYIHYFFLLPMALNRKKVVTYLGTLFILLSVCLTIEVIIENRLFEGFFDSGNNLSPTRVLRLLWNSSVFILFTSMIKVATERFQFESKKQQLENEKLVTELNYLKAQINPHFLFNTLHNLNSLIYSNAQGASEVIIKLSNIMRYMIYESSREQVPLIDEINYMNDYIGLEGIRLNNSFAIEMNVSGNINSVRIAPLILFPLLENAFKHGVSDEVEGCWIKTDIYANDQKLSMHIKNKKLLQHRKDKSGFGLDNLKRRLQLSYPTKHDLQIHHSDKEFEVRLELTI